MMDWGVSFSNFINVKYFKNIKNFFQKIKPQAVKISNLFIRKLSKLYYDCG